LRCRKSGFHKKEKINPLLREKRRARDEIHLLLR
jgi:hypothetical protein